MLWLSFLILCKRLLNVSCTIITILWSEWDSVDWIQNLLLVLDLENTTRDVAMETYAAIKGKIEDIYEVSQTDF